VIDVHCHILPGLDDGPKLLKETIAMAKAAADDGIDTIIATPHHNNGRYINERSDILGATDFVNGQLQRMKIPVDILPGQEVHMYDDMVNDLERGLILPLNQSTKYILIDLPPNHIPPFAPRLLFDLQIAGYIPIIAHPEKNAVVAGNPDAMYNMVSNGAIVQIDAASITGRNGKKVRKLTRQMLSANMVHVIASNAHGAKGFHLTKAYNSLDTSTKDILLENSEELINDRPIAKDEPLRIAKRGLRQFFK